MLFKWGKSFLSYASNRTYHSSHAQVLDLRAITRSAAEQRLCIEWDPVHFLPFVYEQFNDWLLNLLCDEDAAWRAAE
jgi:hypothetical protein